MSSHHHIVPTIGVYSVNWIALHEKHTVQMFDIQSSAVVISHHLWYCDDRRSTYIEHCPRYNGTAPLTTLLISDDHPINQRWLISNITSLTIVYSTVYSGADQRKQFPAQMASNAENVSIWCQVEEIPNFCIYCVTDWPLGDVVIILNFKISLWRHVSSSSCKIGFKGISQVLTGEKSTL